MTREEMNNWNKRLQMIADRKLREQQQALIRPHLKPRQLPLDLHLPVD